MLVVLLDCIVGFTDSETAVDILGDTLAMLAGCSRGLDAFAFAGCIRSYTVAPRCGAALSSQLLYRRLRWRPFLRAFQRTVLLRLVTSPLYLPVYFAFLHRRST